MNLSVRPALAAVSRIAAAAFALASVLSGASALAADALPYARGYLLTGSYVASGVDLTDDDDEFDRDGFVTGTIHIKGVPADADIVAAYLYYETITPTWQISKTPTATFRGEKVLLNDLMAVKKSKQDLTGKMGACWSWGGAPLTVTMVRVDVLRWLPIRLDKDNKATGKRLVNDRDLIAHHLPLHKIKLPVRRGFRLPESAGASLVIVYRDPSQPLRKIVLYDGIRVQSAVTEVTSQNLRGFYKSSSKKSAQLTEIFASGRRNDNRRIFFDDGTKTQISPFDRDDHRDRRFWGDDNERGWWTQTFDVSQLMKPGNNSGDGYGETAKTIIDHWPAKDDDRRGYDCLTLGAIIFQTSVADVDGDGLPDGLEDAASGLKDPDNQVLPNLNKMGASSSHKDLFVEFNGMWAAPGTAYGGNLDNKSAPYDAKNNITTLVDAAGHNHMPTPEMLKLIGDAYVAHAITPHFDVGNIDLYHAPNPSNDPQKLGVVPKIDPVSNIVDFVDDYTSTVADQYLVPSAYARGGEVIKEVACNRAEARCQFPDFPGTVGWKFGLEGYRDQPVGNDGEELSSYANWNAPGAPHRRRFDRERLGLFHYVLYAHARGNPKSDFPCLVGGVPGPDSGGTCMETDNADFHHPTTASGVADLPGGNVLVSMGLWDYFLGRPFPRASTTFHELGHNLNLWHGGFEATWGNLHPLSGSPTSTYIEPNCKPNYLSSMSYLYQIAGMFDRYDQQHLDLSDRDFMGTALNQINETAALTNIVQPDTPASPALYVPAWFAPVDSPLAKDQGASASKRFCDGSKFGAVPPVPTTRVHAQDIFSAIAWTGDPLKDGTAGPQNVNFDATPDGKPTYSTALRAFNDWAAIRLDQVGAGRRAVKFQGGDFADFGSGDFTDFGSGDFTDFGSGDFTDFGSGDFTDFGSGLFLIGSSGDFVDFGSGDFTDFGSGDFTDFGSGDFLDFGSGSERQELDFETAKALTPTTPYGLTACIVGQTACTTATPPSPQYHRIEVDFHSSSVGHLFQYVVERKTGGPSSTDAYVIAGTTTTLSFIDQTELPDGQNFTYRVRAEFDDETPHRFSPWSQPVTIGAVNDAPASHDDAFTVNEDTPLTTGNVLDNDTDDDSPHTSLKAVLVSGPAHGALVLNPNGTFSYTPGDDAEGTDSFTYKANDGLFGTIPMSADSSPASTVTITVRSRHTVTNIASTLPPGMTYGQSVSFKAIVTPVTAALGTLHGQVVFIIDGVAQTPVAINAPVTPPLLSAGTHTITAKYCGGDSPTTCAADSNVFYDSSRTISFLVNQAISMTSVTCVQPQTYTGAALTPCTATVTGAGGLNVTTTALTYTGDNINAAPTPTPVATASYAYPGDANHTGSGGSELFLIIKAPSTTTVTCPADALYDGTAQTPCSAAVTGAGGLSQSLTVNYLNNTNLGTATAGAQFAEDANHFGSSDSKTFTIRKLSWSLTTSDGCTPDNLDVSISGYAISMGHLNAGELDAQPACIHGASALLQSLGAGNTKYKITFTYNLATWDAYNAFTGGATGYWDSFSVSVSNTPYQNLTSLTDPITTANLPGLAFVWGGSNYGDGILECNNSTMSCTLSTYATATATVPATIGGPNYLNVVLDTKTTPYVDATHPSYGTIEILSVVPVP